MSVKNFSKGFLFGSITGGLLALLLNPRRGDENQQFLQKKREEFTNESHRATENLQRIQKNKEVIKAQLQEVIPKTTADLKKEITAFQFQQEPKIKEIKKQIQQIQTNLSKK